MKNIFLPFAVSGLFLLVSCTPLPLGVTPLMPAQKQSLINLGNKTYAELDSKEQENTKNLLEEFFTRNIDYFIWYKNKKSAALLDETQETCKKERENLSPGVTSSEVIDKLEKTFSDFLTKLQDFAPIDIYRSVMNFAKIQRDLAATGCGSTLAAKKAKRTTQEKYLGMGKKNASNLIKINKVMEDFFKNLVTN